MLSASFDFRRAIAQNTKTLVKGTLTLADGTVRELTGDDLMMGSTSFTDSVSSAGSFDIGAAIIGRLSLSLNNYDGRFDAYDFEGAEIVPYVGVRLAGGIEWIRKGVYGIEQPETYGNVIGMGALDNMRKLERAYAGVATTYPATLGTIAQDICTHCGVTLATSDFANRSFVVQERPDDTSLTCIAMLAYVAQASGNWARCDVWGRVRLDWYDTSAFEGEAWLDGDRFDGASPYASGDTANGGDFSNYGAGATVDGGGFSLRPWAHVFALASLSVATDDVVVTGVRATAQDGEGDQTGESYLFGSEGYVLELPDNPLVQYGTAQAVASQVGARVVGMRFRPFDISALGDPTVEAGDPIIITDGKQRQYRSYLTTLTYKVGSYEAMACHAESPGRNRADSYTALTRALVKLRNADRDERSARELAVENLARQLAESSGLYMTSVPQQDGSSIYYMHDKPTLAQSQIVWKLTANAFGISTDGGRTYPYGLDVNGDAILNRIYAIGLNADYINAGSLTIRDGNTTVLSANAETGVVVLQDVSGNMWNMHTGQYRLAATSTIGGRTVSDVLDAVDATVTGVDVEYAQNQSRTNPPTTGWDTTAPAWQEGWYIWSRTATTTAEGTTYSDPVCISGRDGSTGTNAATIYLYQRATTAPARPSSSLTYTFSTGELAGSLGSWTRGIPDGADTCWVTVASAISNGDTDAIAPSEWSDPVELAAGGVDGLNQAFIYLHKRAWPWRARGSAIVAPSAAISVSGTTATVAGTVSGTTLTLASDVPAPPSGALTYTFATGVLAGNLEGWSRGVPDGDAPCWVTTAVAISSEATDLIGASEWAEVVKLVEDGEGSTVETVEYAIGGSGTQAPTGGWGTTVPSVAPGMWLWTRTTYSEGDEAYTCAYMGTDGADGKSVAIRSVTKEGRTTTLVLASTDGTTETLTIVDGEDGDNGTAGASGYVHVAWATSADGTQGFSTHDSEGKTYIGVYTDNTEADSQSPADYSWSLIKGADGRGISSTATSYGTSGSGATRPTTWQDSLPATSQGDWLWVRTVYTYTDNTTSTTYAQSYIGTDGQDGTSVVISSASKVGKVTTVTMQTIRDGVVVDTDTLTISDGSDGPRGIAGATGYLHVAWATSQDGTQGFSTTESAGKTYIGVYSDNEPDDSAYPVDYSWSKIKGETGVGVSAIVEQYYLSTSSTTQAGGSWGTAQPEWAEGRYIWTRSAITWTDGRTTYTDPVLAKAINGANQEAKAAHDLVVTLDESLDQEGVFNRLTNDGETQGIYLEDGRLYLNATYMRTGTLDASLIKAGALVVSRNGTTVLSANLDTGVVSISGDCITIGGESATEAITRVRATYGTCSTDAGSQDKVVDCAGFALRTGAMISVKFTNANTASSPRLNVNGTGAKYIRLNGSYLAQSSWWKAGQTMAFTYDGSSWVVSDGAVAAQVVTNTSSISSLVTRAESIEATVSGVQATYGTCSTEGATALKECTIANFKKYVGQTVTVRFTNANTASSPRLKVQNSDGTEYATGYIYVNGSYMASDQYWGANGTLTFVWNGSNWLVGDGQTVSSIKALKDSISLSVSNATLGSTASITLSVAGSTTTRNLDLTNVRNAFRDDHSAITISAGVVTFNSNTFVVNSTNFSVTSAGVITATSGTIGGFTIGTTKLYSSKSSLTSNTSGVYVGTDGISVGSGSAYTALAGGYLRGGNASNITGYVGFNNYWEPSGVYGTRLAGRGCIALLTSGPFGIGSYYNYGSDATITTGQTKSITYLKSVSYNGSVSVSVTPSYLSERWCFYNSSGSSVHYTNPVSIMTGVTVSVTIPGLTRTTETIQFTKGLMTTS